MSGLEINRLVAYACGEEIRTIKILNIKSDRELITINEKKLIQFNLFQ
jgi:hypothetical protein